MINTQGRTVRPRRHSVFSIDQVNELQAAGLRRWYGVRAIAWCGLCYVAREDWQLAQISVNGDPLNSAIGRGLYLGGNGTTVLVPAWTLDSELVDKARRRARLKIARRSLRWVSTRTGRFLT